MDIGITLSKDQYERMARQLERMEQIAVRFSAVDTDQTEPMTGCLFLQGTLREDIVSDVLDPQSALRNTLRTKEGYIQMPRVVE